MFVCALRLCPATPGWGVRCGCVCLGSGFGCAPPLLAGMLGCMCVCVRAPLVHRHSWLGCAVWVCVFRLGFRLRPATRGLGVRVCVCLCARSACTPILLAGVCSVGVCAWARLSAAPRHSWLGCWSVCVFVCALRLYPATPGWGVRCGCVCLSLGLGCAPPLLAWVLGCVCLCARSACTPPLLAGVCGVGVGAWARVFAAPRHSWLGSWGVCVFVCALRLYLGTPGWGVRCGCVCFGSGFECAPPLLAGMLGCVCPCVRAPPVTRHSSLGCAVWMWVLGIWFRLHPATPGWAVGVCVFLCARSACAPPLLAGVCGVGVCVWARASAAPRHSWLGCWGVCLFVCALCLCPATPGWGVRCGCVCLGLGFGCAPLLLVWVFGCVCVFVCALRLYPDTPDWGVQCGCVCLGSAFGCAPPLLAGLLECVCFCVRAPLVPRHSRLGRAVWVCVFGLGFLLRPATPGWGPRVYVCVYVQARLVPRHSRLGRVVCGLGVAWHLFLCRASLPVVPAARVYGTRWPLLLGTCRGALVVGGGVPLWRAWWPRIGLPRLVRSGRSRFSGRLSTRRGAFPQAGGSRPRIYWTAARGTWRLAEKRAFCACPWPLPRQQWWARSAS